MGGTGWGRRCVLIIADSSRTGSLGRTCALHLSNPPSPSSTSHANRGKCAILVSTTNAPSPLSCLLLSQLTASSLSQESWDLLGWVREGMLELPFSDFSIAFILGVGGVGESGRPVCWALRRSRWYAVWARVVVVHRIWGFGIQPCRLVCLVSRFMYPGTGNPYSTHPVPHRHLPPIPSIPSRQPSRTLQRTSPPLPPPHPVPQPRPSPSAPPPRTPRPPQRTTDLPTTTTHPSCRHPASRPNRQRVAS